MADTHVAQGPDFPEAFVAFLEGADALRPIWGTLPSNVRLSLVAAAVGAKRAADELAAVRAAMPVQAVWDGAEALKLTLPGVQHAADCGLEATSSGKGLMVAYRTVTIAPAPGTNVGGLRLTVSLTRKPVTDRERAVCKAAADAAKAEKEPAKA